MDTQNRNTRFKNFTRYQPVPTEMTNINMMAGQQFKCCGQNRNTGCCLVSCNILAGVWHFILALTTIIISLQVSDNVNDGERVLSYIFLLSSASLIIYTAVYSLTAIFVKNGDKCCNYTRSNCSPKTTNCCGCMQCFINPWLVCITVITFILGVGLAAANINGTFPIVYTTSITSIDKVLYPWNSNQCTPVGETNPKTFDDVWEWLDCIRDSQAVQDYQVYDYKNGYKVDWEDSNGKNCQWYEDNSCADDTLNENPPTSEYNAKYVCTACGGGEKCQEVGGYPCFFSSNLANFTVLEGPADDPTRFIPNPTFKVLTGDSENKFFSWVLIFTFSAITSFFHFLLGYIGYVEIGSNSIMFINVEMSYIENILKGKSPFRWLEYSITATIMFTIVLSLNRVTDIFIVIFAGFVSIMYNTFGAAIDYIPDENFCVICWMWAISAIGYIGQFVLVFFYYSLAIAPYVSSDNNTANELWGQLFNLVLIVNVGLFFSFSLFPLLNIFHQCNRFQDRCKKNKSEKGCCDYPSDGQNRKGKCMARVELWYIILSFISKTLLTLTVLIGSIDRRNDEE